MTKCLLMILCVLVAGCATTFQGEAHIPGGARGCYERCLADNMEMDSYVYMGEYSTACVCRMKGVASGASQSSAAHGGAAVGVVLQQQRQQQQAAQVQVR